MRSPTLHGNEFVSAERILQAALEDGPIGFMLLEVSPSSLPAFGFVPTGADKGVEMEVEVDKEVTMADIPKPYQHLRDVFDEVEADKLPHHTKHDLHLELLEGGKPPQGPLYLKGPREMAELRKYLDENLEKGFIRPSKSPARSPVLFVPKKDGGLRLCVDYRGLNEITVKNRAPLPLIEEQLFLLRKARIYTKLDLRAAYNLIRIAKGDEWKTAFGTQLGLYEYLVMPFGLANAPAHFQSFINDIFRDIIGVYVVVYLDDFLIFSDTEESHVKHVTEVLTRLRSNRLFAKLSKCEFHTKIVEFLGYIIKPTGIEMDPEKVRTVKEWPMPASIHDIQWFLGFANFYRRFIAHFARIAKPLTSLVKPTERFRKFELPEEAQQAFHQLIQAFTTAGVLQHFDYHLPTRLETDTSDFAIAGVLKQEHEDRWHPVAFYSRKMSSAERNYEIHDKELLAVARWAVLLADFDFILQYRPGDKEGEPDALTRRADMQPAGEEQEHNVRQLLSPRVFAETADHDSTQVAPMLSMEAIASKGLKDLVKIFQPLDQELQEIHMKKPFEVKDNLWYSGGRLVIPKVTMPGRTNNRHIRPSKSPARSPVLFVPKKDGGLRLCVDYRGLNEITVKNRAPLPLIEEQLFLLRKARIYTKLDLRAAYNLIRIAKGDEWKTAFGTQLGLYEYLVMPFGLANAPAHFQSFINDIFRDIIGVYVVVYLDDFLIFSDTEESHVKHVTEVLTRLRSNRLFAKLSKCEFHIKMVEFLGYIIKPTGIEMDPEKVRTVKEWPMPVSIHDIQRFLGFANFYRRFIAHFARIAKPLTSLVKPTERFRKFELPEEAQQAFHQLIQAFTSAGVLQHFDYHLQQGWRPMQMSSAERNYEIHDKELLAVVTCLTQWRHMLAGLPSQLVILTDHEALKYFKSQ
ncbi:uncharacterized protein UDID_18214 [Ustilago sp. UG-2017a]|nr:uncharacterized protein UDID_18214 [Ustilago sp. UG-2017a]